MAQINIPDDLLHEVEQALPGSVSTEDFVADAVRRELVWRQRKTEFYRLSDATRRMMDKKGISEEEMLADFDAFRESSTT